LILTWVAAMWWEATNRPLEGWDAMVMWFLKGRVLFEAGTVPAAFFTDSVHYAGYAHLDYPLMVPLTIAQTYAWTGDVDVIVKGWWALLAGAAAAGIYWGLSGLAGRPARLFGSLLLLSLPALADHAGGYYVGYADLPLAVYFLYGATFLYRWWRESGPAEFGLAALFFCLAGTIKNEGLVAAGTGLALLVAFSVARRRLTPSVSFIEASPWAKATTVALMVILILLPWQLEKAVLHIAGDIQPVAGAAWEGWSGRIGVIVQSMAAEMFNASDLTLLWPLLVVFGAGAFFFSPRKAWLSLPLIVLLTAQLAGDLVAYLVSPHDPNWQISTSVDRVIFQSAPVAVLLCTIYLDLLIRPIYDASFRLGRIKFGQPAASVPPA